ncbi:APC family permease [Leucobacter japonicus]|uniref:APC family permease n=1 Tax=Leucobacter japonicus TaxID=1461259 RepID=UPI0006A77CE1|nr:APC family permease [Leucobacter japonicus]
MTEMTTTAQTAQNGGDAPTRLTGHMNTFKLVLSVLAFSSPLTCMAGYFSLTIGVNGVTAPLAFVFVAAALLVFTVGYMAMTRRMRRPGAYYAYITTGLGRVLGLGSAYVAIVSYLAILIGLFCFVGIVIQGLVSRFGGPEIPWWIGSLACVIIVGILGYFNIDVSVRILVWVMVLEVSLTLIFNLAVLFQGGAEGIPLGSFNLAEFTGPEAWVGFLFAILVFIGFEATVLYRDEVKDPDRTIPRATYISVILIGGLYVFSVWMLVAAFGSGAQQVANDNLAEMFTMGASQFIGVWFADVVNLLLITAVIAALLSIHNASTRYIFNMGTDGGLAKAIGGVHPRFRSPYRASLVSSMIAAATVLAFAIGNSDPNFTYAALAGVGSTGIIMLMVLVSASVVVWFRRNPKEPGENLWKTLIAPLASTLFFLTLAIFALVNYDLVVGGAPGELDWLLLILAAPFLAGLIVALVLKSRNPDQYALIGGTDREADAG